MCVGFKLLTEMAMKSTILWGATLSIPPSFIVDGLVVIMLAKKQGIHSEFRKGNLLIKANWEGDNIKMDLREIRFLR
jgi:hypothetical protein